MVKNSLISGGKLLGLFRADCSLLDDSMFWETAMLPVL